MTQHWTIIKSKRERRFYAMLPLLIIPFLTVAFWALGGGRDKRVEDANKITGINASLPAPLLSKEPKDKLEYYEAAEKKASKLNELMKGDPFYDNSTVIPADSLFGTSLIDQHLPAPVTPYKTISTDEMENKVNQKLQQLETELNSPQKAPRQYSEMDNNNEDVSLSQHKAADTKQDDTATADPELDQLDGMLNKILDIQHPERITSQLRAQSLEKKDVAFPVEVNNDEVQVSLLVSHRGIDSPKNIQRQKFYGLSATASLSNSSQSNIKAVIDEPQVVTEGAVVKLRLCSDVFVGGVQIPNNQIISGIVSFKGERMTVKVKGIQCKGILIPVNLSVFDMDAIEGIYIPGLISRDAMKQSTDNALRSVMLNSLNPSIGTQAANAGIEAAKNLVGKKVKQIKVTVKPGHQVFLCNDKY